MTNNNPQAAAALAGLTPSSLDLLLVVTRAAVALPAGDQRGQFLRACLAALDAAELAGCGVGASSGELLRTGGTVTPAGRILAVGSLWPSSPSVCPAPWERARGGLPGQHHYFFSSKAGGEQVARFSRFYPWGAVAPVCSSFRFAV